jgi:chromosome segregation protein
VFTRHAVSFHAPDSELHGVVSRQREIERLEGAIAAARADHSAARAAAAVAERSLTEQRARLDELRETINDRQRQHHGLQLEAMRLGELDTRVRERGGQVGAELAEIDAQAGVTRAGEQAAARRIGELRAEVGQQRNQGALVADLLQRAENVLQMQREACQRARDEAQQATFHKMSCDSKINEIDNSIKTVSEDAERRGAALAARQKELAGYDESLLQEKLQQALAVSREREQALTQVRDALESMEGNLRGLDEERHAYEQKLEPLRGRIAEMRLKEQEARLNEEQHAQKLAEAGASEEDVARQLEKGARPGALQGEINRLTEEIRVLGAVNLAALEELRTARERKDYLDAQSRDLTEAMATLEDAIRRIDRETREMLRQTFEDANRHFGVLFPELFGGGEARLEMTGEEILDAGIEVRAQPPGKRTATIHLLSGGEKALTAIALVFALFQLNPAPFCLLDEVDAPLDDTNTGRFCDLVKRMSAQTQFLFISHNKISMEMAEQLVGVTMPESGVSRVVSVDIDQALRMREELAA